MLNTLESSLYLKTCSGPNRSSTRPFLSKHSLLAAGRKKISLHRTASDPRTLVLYPPAASFSLSTVTHFMWGSCFLRHSDKCCFSLRDCRISNRQLLARSGEGCKNETVRASRCSWFHLYRIQDWSGLSLTSAGVRTDHDQEVSETVLIDYLLLSALINSSDYYTSAEAEHHRSNRAFSSTSNQKEGKVAPFNWETLVFCRTVNV